MEHTNIQQLQQLLLDHGFSEQNLMKAYAVIDSELMTQISADIVSHLTEEQKKKYETLIQTNASADDVAAFLNISEDNFIELYTQKLQEYITHFSTHLPSLQDAISQATES